MWMIIISIPVFKQLENEAISAINVFTGVNIQINEKGGRIDMLTVRREELKSTKTEK